ncbi:MAG: hypothetical protein QOG80_1850 [Pseudonocardiales bacterium]|jgi:hypothetical protein|nr:hypothetical protein [Pseudonocardiales bacterium]
MAEQPSRTAPTAQHRETTQGLRPKPQALRIVKDSDYGQAVVLRPAAPLLYVNVVPDFDNAATQ